MTKGPVVLAPSAFVFTALVQAAPTAGFHLVVRAAVWGKDGHTQHTGDTSQISIRRMPALLYSPVKLTHEINHHGLLHR